MGECCSRGSSRCQRDGEPPPVALEKGTGPEFRWREETQRGTETAPGLSEGARGGPGRTGTQWWGLEGLQATPGRGAPGLRRPTCSRSWAMSLISLFRRASSWACGRTMVGSGSGPGPRRWATFTAAVWGPAPRHALSLPGDSVHTPPAFRHHPVPASAPHTCCSGREPPGPAPLWAPTGISPPSWPVHP